MSAIELFRDHKAAIPAHLQQKDLSPLTKSLMGGAGNGSKRISIKGSVFRMIVGGREIAKNEDRAMDVVIVAAAEKNSRSYYEGVFQEGSMTLPDCWSSDGLKPDAKAASPQHKNCIDCPMNRAGSGQGTSRACRYNRRLAVVLANDIENSDVYQLVLPAQSIFGKGENGKMPLQAYAELLGGNGLVVESVVTEMRFDTSSATPKLTFRAVRPLNATEYEIAVEKGTSAEAKSAITFNPAQIDRGEAGAKAVAPKAEEAAPLFRDAPAPKAKRAVEEEPAEEVPAPVVREKKQAAAPKDLEGVLSDWGDDE